MGCPPGSCRARRCPCQRRLVRGQVEALAEQGIIRGHAPVELTRRSGMQPRILGLRAPRQLRSCLGTSQLFPQPREVCGAHQSPSVGPPMGRPPTPHAAGAVVHPIPAASSSVGVPNGVPVGVYLCSKDRQAFAPLRAVHRAAGGTSRSNACWGGPLTAVGGANPPLPLSPAAARRRRVVH